MLFFLVISYLCWVSAFMKKLNQKPLDEKVKKKIGRPPPNWLLDLPAGKYSIEELEMFCEKYENYDTSSIRKVLRKHGADTKYIVDENGRSHAIYVWKGIKNLY